jgi:hypothetical protein
MFELLILIQEETAHEWHNFVFRQKNAKDSSD